MKTFLDSSIPRFLVSAVFLFLQQVSVIAQVIPPAMPSSFITKDVLNEFQVSSLDCNGASAQSCPYDNTPVKHVCMNFHFVCKEDGTGNFNESNDGTRPPSGDNAYKRAEKIIAEMNKQIMQNDTAMPPTQAAICKPNIQFDLCGVFIHKIPYKPDINEYLGTDEDGKDIYSLSADNSEAFIKKTLLTLPNSDREYNMFFYPLLDGKTGNEGGLNGYTYFGKGFGVSYGNWTSYVGTEKNKTNPDLWFYQAHAKTMIHEFFHSLGLMHTFSELPFGPEKDNCDDTYDENPPCWAYTGTPPCIWGNISNNIMDYNGSIDWSLSPCQICRLHQSLEGKIWPNMSDYLSYTGCTRPKALVYIPDEICNNPYGYGVTMIAEGTASSNETSYAISIGEIDASTNQILNTKSKSYVGNIGKTNIGTAVGGYNFKVGKTYRLKVTLRNDCFVDEFEKDIKIKECNQTALSGTGQNNITSINVYPNPAQEMISIDYEVVNPTNTKIELIDIQTNQLVSTIKEMGVEEVGLKSISQALHSGIRSGQYIVRFVSNEFVLNSNVFINR